MDPEIAALLGVDTRPKADAPIPDFASLFPDASSGGEGAADEGEEEELDLAAGSFPEITRRLEEVPHIAFDDPNYYKTALSGEGDIAQRIHGILQKYLNAKDPKDRGVFRQQLIPAYWEFITGVCRKAPGKLPDPKKYLLRFGVLHPTFLERETRTFFSQIIVDNYLNQPVYYLDEWFRAVGTGTVRN